MYFKGGCEHNYIFFFLIFSLSWSIACFLLCTSHWAGIHVNAICHHKGYDVSHIIHLTAMSTMVVFLSCNSVHLESLKLSLSVKLAHHESLFLTRHLGNDRPGEYGIRRNYTFMYLGISYLWIICKYLYLSMKNLTWRNLRQDGLLYLNHYQDMNLLV